VAGRKQGADFFAGFVSDTGFSRNWWRKVLNANE
jgi:hypothetical protein